VGQWVAVLYTIVPVLMVPLYQDAKSIIALLQQLNGLYSMPVLAVFIVAIAFSGVDGRAARAGLGFGAALYAVFTFAWTPLHYIHLMFITLVATVGFILLLSRWMSRSGGARVAVAG
jgi:SSS family solute:Na+ symporter